MTLDFTSDGHAHCLYDEAIDLHALGRLTIERASTIEFNAVTQHWEVHVPDAAAKPGVHFSHPSRQACLDWERANLLPTSTLP